MPKKREKEEKGDGRLSLRTKAVSLIGRGRGASPSEEERGGKYSHIESREATAVQGGREREEGKKMP